MKLVNNNVRQELITFIKSHRLFQNFDLDIISIYTFDDNEDIQYANELHLQNTHPKYNILDDYIKNIVQYFHQLYDTYPQWVSKDKFIEIGYTLFSLIKYLNLDFSTNDLSDNFVFKYSPKQ